MTSNHRHDTATARVHRCTRVDAICVLLLIAYFLHFAVAARRGGFREDEMLNMWIYWRAGTIKSLLANLTFWTTFYRPGGALYYLPLYHFFRLDPLPYRIVQISILAAAIPIAYYLARLLACSRSVALLAALALCYHAALANLVFVGAFIYDVLCGFFYLAALTYYVRLREQDVRLRPAQLLVFLLLYVLALDSKEMAVTLPTIILIYEFLRAPRWADYKAFLRWTWRYATPSLIAGTVTAIYLYGKLYGSNSLTRLDPYRPRYSWHQFAVANSKFLGQLFFAQNAITPTTFWIFWVVVFIYAVLRRDRAVRLMAFWVVVVPLPLAFLVPIRGGGSLYLVLFGWAMIFARVACDFAVLLSKAAITAALWIRMHTGINAMSRGRDRVLWRGPVERALGGTVITSPASIIRIAIIVIFALSLGIFIDWENRSLGMARALVGIGQNVNHVVGAIKSLNLSPVPGSTVLLKMEEQPFQNKWHPLFIASLVWNDHSLQIWVTGLTKLTPEQLKETNYVISLTKSQAKVIRSPDASQSE